MRTALLKSSRSGNKVCHERVQPSRNDPTKTCENSADFIRPLFSIYGLTSVVFLFPCDVHLAHALDVRVDENPNSQRRARGPRTEMRAKEVNCYFTVGTFDLQSGEILQRVPERFEKLCVGGPSETFPE